VGAVDVQVDPRPLAGEQASEPPRLHLRLLDGFELEADGIPVALPVSAQRLLALVALRSGGPPRSHAAVALWPGAGQYRARGNLRSALWRLRQAGPLLVEGAGEQLRLSPGIDVDAVRLRRASRDVLAGREGDHDALLADGALLPEWDDDWVALERERLTQLRLHALEHLCAELTEEGRFGEAVDAALAAVRADPHRESAHRALIAAHLAEGNAAEAVRRYRACRAMLRRDLGVGPSEQLERLIARHPTVLVG